jgi:GR25 family glycosyltransferase involved in LPS biosynthesis
MWIKNRAYDSHNHRIKRPDQVVSTETREMKESAKTELTVKNALVISLKRSQDRLNRFYNLNRFDGLLEVIEGIDGAELKYSPEAGGKLGAGDLGTLLSHRKAIEYAKNKGYQTVLILEDDVEFVPNFTEMLKQAMSELPISWDALWLGGANRQPDSPYSSNLRRLASTWGAFGYILRDTTYNFWIEKLSEENAQCDDIFSQYQSRFRCFRTVNPLVVHKGNVSVRSAINLEASQKAN